jgi:hypothetical protein
MKTTLNQNDTLLIEAEALAAQERTSLERPNEEGPQLCLHSRPARPNSVRLPVYRCNGGLASGLDGRSNKPLLDAADSDT